MGKLSRSVRESAGAAESNEAARSLPGGSRLQRVGDRRQQNPLRLVPQRRLFEILLVVLAAVRAVFQVRSNTARQLRIRPARLVSRELAEDFGAGEPVRLIIRPKCEEAGRHREDQQQHGPDRGYPHERAVAARLLSARYHPLDFPLGTGAPMFRHITLHCFAFDVFAFA